MKTTIATAATIIVLVSSNAAFAEGGYVDEQGFINAQAPHATAQSSQVNDNATRRVVQTNERNQAGTAEVTVFVSDAQTAGSAIQGR